MPEQKWFDVEFAGEVDACASHRFRASSEAEAREKAKVFLEKYSKASLDWDYSEVRRIEIVSVESDD